VSAKIGKKTGKKTGKTGRTVGAATVAAWLVATGPGPSCTPDIAQDPVPVSMELDLQASPPRAPQPTSLLINPMTGKIDFSITGLVIPANPGDCAMLTTGPSAALPISQAECELDVYLQTLDGFPTVTPAQAPATADLDPDTLTVGANVVVVATKGQSVVSAITTRATSDHNLSVRPQRSWTLGELYWVGVRGYDNGVRASDGREVVGSPTQALLKQETSLTCGADAPASLDPSCPAFALLRQSSSTDAAAADSLFALEAIRLAYVPGWQVMSQIGGLPRAESAVLWSFPIHTSSVAELDPTVGLVPRVTAIDEIHIAVQGPVDSATVSPFVVAQQFGSILIMDLSAAQAGDLRAGFPIVDARFEPSDAGGFDGGEIVIKGHDPFVAGHQYGLFFSDELHDPSGGPLVPSPISVLLRLRGSLTDETGHSTISTVSDADAALLEAGRLQLATLFDDPSFAALTGVTRESLVYCYAFPLQVAP